MFARTERLLLRPGWAEDAPALTAAITHERVVRTLARAPWPYALADAEAFLALPRAHDDARFVIVARGRPDVIGGVELVRQRGSAGELGYWLTPTAWGRGYATEAATAVVGIAREALRCERLVARHHVDHAASARVLAKLGFRETGRSTAFSRAHGADVVCVDLALDLRVAPAVAAAA